MSHRVIDDSGKNGREIGSGPSSRHSAEDIGASGAGEVSHLIHRVEPPPKQNLLNEFKIGFKETFFHDEPLRHFKDTPGATKFLLVLRGIFPILDWGRRYTLKEFKGDLIAGLTIASLCIPQVKYFPSM